MDDVYMKLISNLKNRGFASNLGASRIDVAAGSGYIWVDLSGTKTISSGSDRIWIEPSSNKEIVDLDWS